MSNLDEAIEALKKYDWGTDIKPLDPIQDAVVATHTDAAARKELETRLAAVLKTDVSRDAKDFVCRKLTIVATAASVPTLAGLLPDKDHSHMARYVLERIPAPEAGQALREALPKVNNSLKVGVIGSLGVRRDKESVSAIAGLLGDADAAVARAAALALGDINNAEAAKALTSANPKDDAVKMATNDARLSCADGLLAAGNKADALAIYKTLIGEDQPKQVRLAGTRGMLACSGK